MSRSFEDMVRRILEVNGYEIRIEGDQEFDFLARQAGTLWAVEVKYYLTRQTEVALVESAARRLVQYANLQDAHRGMLVVSSTIPAETRLALEDKHGILLVDRSDLWSWSRRHPDLLDELGALLEGESTPDSLKAGRDPASAREKGALPPGSPTVSSIGEELCRELAATTMGKGSWRAYERLCERILRFLFPIDLHAWHKQSRTDDGLSRFDFVCRIKSDKAFWRFLIEHLGSRYVVFEFKNHTGAVKQGQILTTEKYLFERGLRRVAIMMSRKGMDRNAKSMVQGAMREHGKLILVLDDKQVSEMLRMRDRGDDPSDLLFDIADQFLLALSR